MIDQTSDNRQYPLPHPDNVLAYDNPRLRAMIIAVDADMKVALERGTVAAALAADVVTVAAGGKLLRLDANGKLPADITGNAASASSVAWASVAGRPDQALLVGDGTVKKLDVGFGQQLNIKAGDNVALAWDAATRAVTISTSGQISGNVETASRLQTSRTIALSGGLSGQADFDGSGNISINASFVSQALTGLVGLGSTGFTVRTATGMTARTLTGASGVSISNGSGVSGNPTITLANTAVTPGSYGGAGKTVSLTVDQQGRLTAVSHSDVSAVEWSVLTNKPKAVTDLAALATSGFAVHTDDGAGNKAVVARSITAGTGINITNPTGSGGNPVVSLEDTAVVAGTYGAANAIPVLQLDSKGRVVGVSTAALAAPTWANLQEKPTTLAGFGISDAQAKSDELTALGGLAAFGFVARTAANAFTVRTLAVSTGLSITNAAGTNGNPSISLANTAVSAGSYGSATSVAAITVDAQGRITEAQGIVIKPDWSNVQNKPTTLQGAGITGGTLSQPLTLAGNGTQALHAVTKQQLDAASAPLSQLHAVALSF